jgi:hypothetical protein
MFKAKMNLLVDVSHLHEAHLHHLEDKTDATNKHLGEVFEVNIWFTSKLTYAVKKKYQSVVHHHGNIIKAAQHYSGSCKETNLGLFRELCFQPPPSQGLAFVQPSNIGIHTHTSHSAGPELKPLGAL